MMTNKEENPPIKIDQSVIDDLKKNHNVDAIQEIYQALHKTPEEVKIIITHDGDVDASKGT